MTVIYSRLDEKADAVIISLARAKGDGSVVVTSDREIRNAVERFGAIAIAANEFSEILRNMDMQSAEDELDEESYSGSKRGNPNRLSKLERRRQEKLKKLKI